MAVDIEKAFDYINHCFLIKVLEKFGYEKDFIKWIEILQQNQEPCKPNKTKCEVAGIGALNGMQVAPCGMRCVDLVSNIVTY